MRSRLHFLLPAIGLAVVLSDAPLGPPEPARHDLTPAQAELLDWGLVLFAEAGLTLPPLEVAGHPDTAPCRGRMGAARPAGAVVRIDLCGEGTGPVAEWVVLHELAHAWDRHALDDERRRAFLRIRGLESWREGEWHERGAEHAAEIVVWGLMDRPVKPGHIDQNSCDELRLGYLTLTGRVPLHGFTDACEA